MYSIDELKTRFTPIFEEQDVRKATLFGSYAKGCAVEASDIDLVVDSGRTGLSFFGIVDALNECVDKIVEVFDTTMLINGSPLETEVKQTGVVIYEK